MDGMKRVILEVSVCSVFLKSIKFCIKIFG